MPGARFAARMRLSGLEAVKQVAQRAGAIFRGSSIQPSARKYRDVSESAGLLGSLPRITGRLMLLPLLAAWLLAAPVCRPAAAQQTRGQDPPGRQLRPDPPDSLGPRAGQHDGQRQHHSDDGEEHPPGASRQSRIC